MKKNYSWYSYIISFWCFWMEWGQRHPFFTISSNSDLDNVILFILQLRAEAKNGDVHSFRNKRVFRWKQSNLLSITIYCEMDETQLAFCNYIAIRISKFEFRILLLALHFFRISCFSHHFNQRIYYDKKIRTKRWRHIQFSASWHKRSTRTAIWKKDSWTFW